MRHRLLVFVLLAIVAAVLALIVLRGLGEAPSTNSYALLADAFLHGHYDFRGCFDQHCVAAGGLNYLAAPPFPAVLAMPFVIKSGSGFSGFVLLSILLAGLALLVWHRIFVRLGIEPRLRLWLLVALGAASPLAETVARGDRLALFAAVAGFLMASLAIGEAIAGRLMTAGFALGLAFLCRPTALFLLPFVGALTLTTKARVLPPSQETLTKFGAIAIGAAVPVLFLLFYDWMRFGAPFETGQATAALSAAATPGDIVAAERIKAFGAYSLAVVPANLAAMAVQGFSLVFDPPRMVRLVGLDPAGASFLAKCPWLLFLFFAPRDRTMAFAALAVLPMLGLFAISSDLPRYGLGRPLIDLLPVLAVYLAVAVRPEQIVMFRLLLLVGVSLQMLTIAVMMKTG
jgi:hypothetical protein